MRASRNAKRTGHGALGKEEGRRGIHISGAEGLFEASEVEKVIQGYYRRALNHSRGLPDEIIITMQKIQEKPLAVSLLPVSTAHCESPGEAREIVSSLLSDSGIAAKAIKSALKVVTGKRTMRGASLMLSRSGVRVEPDRERGVRVSRLGIDKETERRLSRRLSRMGINTQTVKEAIILASKVASCKGIVAELCVSDDPDYTTGYVASRRLGYVRIPNVKRKGSLSGGRVFFVEEDAKVGGIIEYLERKPVIVSLAAGHSAKR